MEVKEMDAGSALALCWLTYVVGCPFVAKLYQLTDRKTCMVLSMALCAASFVLIGPSQVIKFEPRIEFIFVGLSLLGFGIAGVTVPIIPELVESVQEEVYNIALA